MQSPSSKLSLGRLAEDFKGEVIGPDDAGYDEARTPFYGGFDYRPTAIIRPADADEVAQVVRLAADTGLDLAVRSGGHSVAGHSVADGGIVLDLAALRGLEIDAENRTAWADTGLTTGEYTTAAAAYGLATGFGDTGSVGIGGITLGGGVGLLARKHGLTIDSVLAADVVTADGELVRVDAESHPDLFWAIRGGGGNFGVVTRFQYLLHEVETVVGGMLMLPATAGVISSFVELAESAPDGLSTIANVMTAPPMPFVPAEHHGKRVVFGLMAFAGPVEEGERVVAPFRALADPLVDMLGTIPYPQLFPPEEVEFHPMAASHTGFLDRVGPPEGEKILESLESSTAMMSVTQLRVLGGAISRVPDEATAYAHRDRRIMANVAALYADPADASTNEAWVSDLAGALYQGDDAAYVNFQTDTSDAGVRRAYPDATWQRLQEIKLRYDPGNLFHLNHNVPPTE